MHPSGKMATVSVPESHLFFGQGSRPKGTEGHRRYGQDLVLVLDPGARKERCSQEDWICGQRQGGDQKYMDCQTPCLEWSHLYQPMNALIEEEFRIKRNQFNAKYEQWKTGFLQLPLYMIRLCNYHCSPNTLHYTHILDNPSLQQRLLANHPSILAPQKRFCQT